LLGAGVNRQPPVQDEAVQAVLGMNQKTHPFSLPRDFQPPSLPQNFPLLPTSYLPPHFYLSHLISFPFTPAPELGRAPEVE